MRLRLGAAAGLMAVLVAAGLTGPARAADPPAIKPIKLGEAGFDFALNPDTGAVAVIVPTADKVVLYPKLLAGDATGSTAVAVGKNPVAVVYKRVGKEAVFAVLTHDGGDLTILDATSLKEIKTVPVAIHNPSSLSASANPADPYVYYAGDRGHDSRMGRVDVAKAVDQGVLGGTDSVMDGAVSGDGRLLYLRGPWSPSGFRVVELPKATPAGERPTVTAVRSEHTDCPGYLPDPAGRFVVSGDRAWAPALDKELARLPLVPVAVSAARPLLYGLDDGRLVVLSAASFKVVGGAAVPLKIPVGPAVKALAVPNGQADFKRFEYKTRVLESATGDAVLVCSGDTAAVIPFAALGVSDEPVLAATLEGSLDATVGVKHTVRVVPSGRDVKVAIADGPRGVELVGDTLVWTPTDFQVGTHVVALALSAKDAEKTQEVTLVVRRPSVQLPAPAQQMAVSEDGAVAVTLGTERFEGMGGEGQSVLTLIDLTKSAVVATQKPAANYNVIAVDAHHVYAGNAGTDTLRLLSRKDLSEVKRVSTEGRVVALVPVADRWLFVATQTGRLMVFAVPGGEPAAPADVGLGFHLTAKGESAMVGAPQRVAGGWLYDGVLFDEAFAKPTGVVRPRGVWSFGSNGVQVAYYPNYSGGYPGGYPGGYQQQGPPPPTLARWGVTAANGTLFQGKRTVPLAQDPRFQNGFGSTTVLADRPATASVRSTTAQTDYNRPPRMRAELVFHDLVSAAAGPRVPLLDEPMSRQFQQFGYGVVTRVEARSGRLACLVADRVFVLPTPKLGAADFQPPLHFAPPDRVESLADKDLTVTLPAIRDEKAPVEYALRPDFSGAEMAGGKLTLRSAAVIDRASDGLVAILANGRHPSSGQPLAPDAMLDAYLAEVGPRFEKLVGRKTQGVPLWLTLGVTARDKTARTAETDVGVFVEVPAAPVRAKAKAAHEEMLARNRPAGAADPRVPELQRRLAEVEKKLDESNAKLDRLLKAQEPKKQ